MAEFLKDTRAEAVLNRLYKLENEQVKAMKEGVPPAEQFELSGITDIDTWRRQYLSDKMVALEPEKAEFCYLQCRALKARRVVEIGTSYGVSTIYLAAAVRENGGGIVIGTEYEPEKSKAARINWAEAGLSEYIDLREGDLRETILDCGGPVDFVLMDIWTPMARPALDLLIPQLSKGAVIFCDNIVQARAGYVDYLSRIQGHDSGFRTMTLPFNGGAEFSVWEG